MNDIYILLIKEYLGVDNIIVEKIDKRKMSIIVKFSCDSDIIDSPIKIMLKKSEINDIIQKRRNEKINEILK